MTRVFYIGMALMMTVVVFAGFWPSYFGLLLSGQGFDGHWIVHIHALVFLGWMATFIAQASLAATRRVRSHMKIGPYAIALGAVAFLMGVIVTLMVGQRFVEEDVMSWSQVPFSRPAIDIVQFAVLLAIGFAYRSRPDIHKRFMLLATVALLPAATSRMGYLIGPWSTELMFAVVMSTIIVHDIYTRGRLHGAYVIGLLILLPRILVDLNDKFLA